MTKWRLRCTECNTEWVLETGMNLSKLRGGRIYHYCPVCRKNTFHVILGREE